MHAMRALCGHGRLGLSASSPTRTAPPAPAHIVRGPPTSARLEHARRGHRARARRADVGAPRSRAGRRPFASGRGPAQRDHVRSQRPGRAERGGRAGRARVAGNREARTGVAHGHGIAQGAVGTRALAPAAPPPSPVSHGPRALACADQPFSDSRNPAGTAVTGQRKCAPTDESRENKHPTSSW